MRTLVQLRVRKMSSEPTNKGYDETQALAGPGMTFSSVHFVIQEIID